MGCVSRVLTNQQYEYIRIYESKIQKLNEKLKTDTSLTDEQKQQIGSEIVDAQDLIDDIRENPEGDYDEDQIEGEIENWTRDNEDNFIRKINIFITKKKNHRVSCANDNVEMKRKIVKYSF